MSDGIRMPSAEHAEWELVVVTEYWRRGDGEAIHSAKWLKLLSGKPTDVLKWITVNRDSALSRRRDGVEA